MVFFDLNIPYLGGKENHRSTRVKTVVKAMELGYDGIAYNFSVHGVLADCHRCSIHPFPLSSLLDLAPCLSKAVEFHREILGLHRSSAFKQYTRLTVVVDNMIHTPALDYDNPILRTYDLIAVQPMNPSTFEYACQKAKVDIIVIDFSQKLPFSLKSPMVKAAIQRDLHFEITYSSLLSDVHARRETIRGAKLLVRLARGKNIIISSSASTVNELRGPYDAANLSTLLGLSMEHAKAALSRNCRSLISNVLRRKKFYKGTTGVEKIAPSAATVENEDSWLGDWRIWDPISSGDGDLLFENVIVTNPVKVPSPTPPVKQKNEQQLEMVKFPITPEDVANEPLAAEGFLQSNGLIKSESSISIQQPMEDHFKTSMVTEDSTLHPTPPSWHTSSPHSPSSKALHAQSHQIVYQVPVNEDAVDLGINVSPQNKAACLLKSSIDLDMCHHPKCDTIAPNVSSVIVDDKEMSTDDALCNKQEQESSEKTKELEPSLLECLVQDSSCFATPLHPLQLDTEKEMLPFDAGVDNKMLLDADNSNDYLSLMSEEHLDNCNGKVETSNGDALLHELEHPSVNTSHISTVPDNFKPGRKSAVRRSLQTVHPLSRKIMLKHSLSRRRLNARDGKIRRNR